MEVGQEPEVNKMGGKKVIFIDEMLVINDKLKQLKEFNIYTFKDLFSSEQSKITFRQLKQYDTIEVWPQLEKDTFSINPNAQAFIYLLLSFKSKFNFNYKVIVPDIYAYFKWDWFPFKIDEDESPLYARIEIKKEQKINYKIKDLHFAHGKEKKYEEAFAEFSRHLFKEYNSKLSKLDKKNPNNEVLKKIYSELDKKFRFVYVIDDVLGDINGKFILFYAYLHYYTREKDFTLMLKGSTKFDDSSFKKYPSDLVLIDVDFSKIQDKQNKKKSGDDTWGGKQNAGFSILEKVMYNIMAGNTVTFPQVFLYTSYEYPQERDDKSGVEYEKFWIKKNKNEVLFDKIDKSAALNPNRYDDEDEANYDALYEWIYRRAQEVLNYGGDLSGISEEIRDILLHVDEYSPEDFKIFFKQIKKIFDENPNSKPIIRHINEFFKENLSNFYSAESEQKPAGIEILISTYKNLSGNAKDNGTKIAKEQLEVEFVGSKFRSPIILAATPLTGISVWDNENGYDVKGLYNKLNFLLEGVSRLMGLDYFPIGAVVLKTVYYDKKTKFDTPLTRVWYEKGPVLYNTGRTPRESLSVDKLKDFMKNYSFKNDNVIISLGLKSSDIYMWDEFFEELFGNGDTNRFNIVEINIRHTLREINRMLAGDELFDEYSPSPLSEAFLLKCVELFSRLQYLGEKYYKKILIKLPFRSDIVEIVRIIAKIVSERKKIKGDVEYGIRGLTLINTIKTFYPDERGLLLEGENVKLQQLSGEPLRGIRDWSIFMAQRVLKEMKVEEVIDISASGAITKPDDIKRLYLQGVKTFQLGTKVLVEGFSEDIIYKMLKAFIEIRDKQQHSSESGSKKESECNADQNPPVGSSSTNLKKRRIEFDESKCIKCGNCLKTYYCDAFINKYVSIIQQEYPPIVEINGNKYFVPKKVKPIINSDYCTGCGLCVQLCGKKALKLLPG